LDARRDDDQAALRRLLAEDVALILPGEESTVGRDNLLATWDRQADLLDAAEVFEADLRAVAGSDDHVFVYIETRAEAAGTAVNYTTLTAYRIRSGQIAEVRQHVDDFLGYLGFWRALGGDAGGGNGAPAPEPPAAPEPEPEEAPVLRRKGFARFR